MNTDTIEAPIEVIPAESPSAPTALAPLDAAVQKSGLAIESAQTLRASFESIFTEAQKWSDAGKAIVVTDESDREGMKKAREYRLELKRVRVNAEKKRKEMKEESLRTGKAIDGVANLIKFLVVPVEKHLEEQEKFAEVMEAARIQKKLEDRQTVLDDLSLDQEAKSFITMSDDEFNRVVEALKSQKEEREKAAAEARRAAEEKARKEAEEHERRRVENERLKAEAAKARKEAEAKERAAAKERARIQAEAAKAQQEAEAKRKAAEEKAAAEARRARELEEAEARRVEEEKKAKAAALRAERAAARKRAAAPDAAKLKEWGDAINRVELPEMKTNEGAEALSRISESFTELLNLIKAEAECL